MLTKQQVILHREISNVTDWEAFIEPMDEPSEFRTFMVKSRDWADMGSPDRVTVTIEPGDLLNGASV